MRFNFKIQRYQTDAVDSVVGVFKGQPYSNPVNYRRDIGKVKAGVSYSQMSFADAMYEQQELALTDDYDDSMCLKHIFCSAWEVYNARSD